MLLNVNQCQLIQYKYLFISWFRYKMLTVNYISAERQGFEPREPRSSTVFKTAAIDHSAISPLSKFTFLSGIAKEQLFFVFSKRLLSYFTFSDSKAYLA